MACEVGGGLRNVMKKGPWTTAEDLILLEYVKKHGEGNWNAVQRNSGLMRCGKSCRLRWTNHLRPNLKKGAFSPQEERLVLHLHAKLGNKWARMAAQIPGRTDNEIKNYWNTRVKRRLRAGLPIYPQEIADQHQQQHSPPTRVLSSLLTSSLHPNPNPFKFNPSENQKSNQLKLYRSHNAGLGLSFSSFFTNQLPIVEYESINAGMEAMGLPSIQSAPALSYGAEDNYEIEPPNQRGLSEDLFGENQNLGYSEKGDEQFVAADFGLSYGVSISHHTHQGVEAEEGIGWMDEEVMKLVEWNIGGDGIGSESSLLNKGTTNPVGGIADEDQDWNFGSCLWNNMPTIH